MAMRSDENRHSSFLQSTAGQLALLGAAIIVLLFFALTFVR
jgi:hypothetical protein